MAKSLKLHFDKRPLAMPRPRFAKNRRPYNPKRYTEWKAEIGTMANKQRCDAGLGLLEGDLSVDIEFHFKHKAKGDIDNYTKALLDAMTNTIYGDDKQIKAIGARICSGEQYDGIYVIVGAI